MSASILSVRYGCMRTRSFSTRLSGPGLSQMAFEMPSRPRSWSNPARRKTVTSDSGRPQLRPAAAARFATPRECPAKYGDFKSARSAIAFSTASSRSPCTQRVSAGSASMIALHSDASSRPAQQLPACSQNRPTRVGSYSAPDRRIALRTASIPVATGVDPNRSGEVHKPSWERDLSSAQAQGNAFAIPLLVSLAERSGLVQAELVSKLLKELGVGGEKDHDLSHARGQRCNPPHPIGPAAVGTDSMRQEG